MNTQRKAYLYAIAAVLLWSTVASAFKLALRHLDPVRLVFYASAVSFLVLGVGLGLRGRLGDVWRMTRTDWLWSAGLGLLNPCLYYLVLFEAYDRLPAQEAQPLNYTWAVTLALLSVPLLKQRIGLRSILALLVSYAGVWVISTRGAVTSLQFTDSLGVGLALGSTVVWALYWIGNTRDRRDPVLALFANFLFGTLYAAAVAVVTSGFAIDPAGLAGAAYVGMFEMGLTFVLWLLALRLSRTTAQVGNLIFFSPFLSLVFIHLVVGERIAPSTPIGLVLILAGNAIQNLGRRVQKGGGNQQKLPSERATSSSDSSGS